MNKIIFSWLLTCGIACASHMHNSNGVVQPGGHTPALANTGTSLIFNIHVMVD